MKDLQEFMEKYLPDYEEKVNDFWKGTCAEQEDDKWMLCEFYEKHFLEALSNYTKIVCEKQREECMLSLSKEISLDIEDGRLYMRLILNAPQPKID